MNFFRKYYEKRVEQTASEYLRKKEYKTEQSLSKRFCGLITCKSSKSTGCSIIQDVNKPPLIVTNFQMSDAVQDFCSLLDGSGGGLSSGMQIGLAVGGVIVGLCLLAICVKMCSKSNNSSDSSYSAMN